MDLLTNFIAAHPLLTAILSPVWGAMVIDLLAFVKAKEPGDWWGQFRVKVALGRYLQAFVGGIVGNIALAGTVGAAGAVVALIVWGW
jgi:hypothetical protein